MVYLMSTSERKSSDLMKENRQTSIRDNGNDDDDDNGGRKKEMEKTRSERARSGV